MRHCETTSTCIEGDAADRTAIGKTGHMSFEVEDHGELDVTDASIGEPTVVHIAGIHRHFLRQVPGLLESQEHLRVRR